MTPTRDVRIALRQIHADGCAGYIIINDTGSGTGVGGVGQLLGEVQLTTGDKDDLAGDIDALVIRGVAQLIQEDVLPFRAGAVRGGVHGGQRRIIIQRLRVDHIPACCLEAGADHAGVVHGGNGEGVGVSAGRAAGVEIDILGIERAVIGVLRPGVGVTGGDADHGVGLGQLVHNALVQITGGEARVAGAKRQVHHIAVQQNGVLDGGHVVGVVRAAGLCRRPS